VPSGGAVAAPKPLRILIADDDRDTANMLALILRDEGHEVQVVLRGDEALDLCRLFRPDVVIADVNMPGTSGYAVARELRERHHNLAPPAYRHLRGMDKHLGSTAGKGCRIRPFPLETLRSERSHWTH
jgi:CheY-like chemotaxis protein